MKELTIASPSDLRELRRWNRRRGLTRVRLRLELPSAYVDSVERTLNRQIRACGCELGAVFVLAAVAVVVARVVLARQGVGSMPALVASLVWLFVAALVGKLLGLAYAEWRVRATIDEMISGRMR